MPVGGPITDHPLFTFCDEMPVPPGESVVYSMEGHRSYPRQFRVGVKVQGLSPITVSRCPGIPIGGSFYVGLDGSGDVLAILRDIKAAPERQDDWQYWLVTCNYTTDLRGNQLQTPDSQDRPELERPSVEWDEETMQYANWFKDRKGMYIGNSAHMPFSPPMSFPLAYPVLNITRNELNFNVTRAGDYAYAINAGNFLGYPRGCVQCMPPKAVQTWKGSYRFWKVTYKIRFSPVLWMPKTPRIAVKFDNDPAAYQNSPAADYDYDPNYDDPNMFMPITEDGTIPPTPFHERGPDNPPFPNSAANPAAGGGILPECNDEKPPWLVKRPGGAYTYYLGWQPLVLDQGMYELPTWPPPVNLVGPAIPPEVAWKYPVPMFRANLPITHPDLLDGSGHQVRADENGYRRPVFLGFIVYTFRDFRSLIVDGLGTAPPSSPG